MKSFSYLKTGLILLAIHSLLAVLIYIEVERNSGIAQAGFVWFWLWFIDTPAIYLGYDLLGALTENISKNLRALLVTGILGGLQWLIIGSCGHFAISAFKNRITIKKRY